MTNETDQPIWWTPYETTAWERVKLALHRDWDQTKYDFGLRFGQDLQQNVADTVRQAVGSEPIPAPHIANPEGPWSDESAVRYGYGAGLSANYRDHATWAPELEALLRADWEAMRTGRDWDGVRLAVRYGWTRSPRTVS